MERNIELLQKTMQHIKDHPEQHHQSTWIATSHCGTAACFAGHAALLSGMTFAEVDKKMSGIGVGNGYTVGGALLGLTDEEACIMFASTNTIEMLELMVKDMVNGERIKARHTYRQEAHGDEMV